MMQAAVVDYGVSNLCSVLRALEHLGYDAQLTSRPEDLQGAERIILAGAGRVCNRHVQSQTNRFGYRPSRTGAQRQADYGHLRWDAVLAQTGMENGELAGIGTAQCLLPPAHAASIPT